MSDHRSPGRPFTNRLRPLAITGAILFFSGCGAGLTTVRFECDGKPNRGTLLTVDVVRATEDEMQKIRALGVRWFYDSMRDSLRDRTRTATFPPDATSCDKYVEVPLTKGKLEKYLVVIADYEHQNPDPDKFIAVLPAAKWNNKKVLVQLRDQELAIVNK